MTAFLLLQAGQDLLNRLAEAGYPVSAACWIKEGDSGQWFLYLVTPLVEEEGGTRSAYRRLGTVYQQIPEEEIGVNPLEIKVIGPHDALAKKILASRQRRLGTSLVTRYGGSLGELNIEQAYVYPRPVAASE